MTRRIPHTFVVLITAVFQAGCFSYHRADRDALPVMPLGENAWPAIDTEGLDALIKTPKEMVTFEFDRKTVSQFIDGLSEDDFESMVDSTVRDLRTAEIQRHGLVRFWSYRDKPARTIKAGSWFTFDDRLERFAWDGQYLTAPTARHERLSRELDPGGPIRAFVDAFLNMYGVRQSNFPDRWQLDDGIGLGLPDTVDERPKGLIVHLTSLIENKYEYDVLRRMESYGWAVSHVATDIFVSGPGSLDADARNAERNRRFEELRDAHPDDPRTAAKRENRILTRDELDRMGQTSKVVWERVDQELPRLDTGFEIYPDTDIDALAAIIAEAVDTRLGEHAYAAEVLLAETERQFPSLTGRPILVMGFSAGALAAPAVTAHLRELDPERPILMVLIGGGASVLDIADDSTLTSGGINLNPVSGPKPMPTQLSELRSAYIAHARLDPIHSVAALRDVPVLHIYASRDTVVPTGAAERLNAVHGSVDRVVHLGNHDTLFFFLNSQPGRIRSWLRSHGIE